MRPERRRESRPHDVMQPHLRGNRVAYALQEAIRVLYLPRHVTVHHNVLLVSREELRGPRIIDSQPAVEIGRALEGPLGVQTGAGHGIQRPSELRDEHEFGFLDREECPVTQNYYSQADGREN